MNPRALELLAHTGIPGPGPFIATGLFFVTMTYGLGARISAAPGPHVLRAEFVAVDHGPFRPRVMATVRFRVVRGGGA